MILIIHAFTPIDCTGMACMVFPLCWQTNVCIYISFIKAMTAQAKPTVEGVDNVPLEENQYEEEETTESVLGIK